MGGWVDFSVRNLYRQLILYSVEQRIKKLERRGHNFNREKIVKEMEAVLEGLTKNATIESMDDVDDKRLERIQDELRLLGYKKT